MGIMFILISIQISQFYYFCILNTITMINEEIFPLVNELGEVIGEAPRSICHNGSKLLHPVIHLHIFNSEGKLYLQKRSMQKDIQPGKWDTAVGGHIAVNESVEDALNREAFEELEITGFIPQFKAKYVFESDIEKELVYSFITIFDGTISPDKVEVEDGKFWDINDIKAAIGKNIFTPNFENEFLTTLSNG